MFRSRVLWKLYAGYAVLVLLTTVILGVTVTRSVQRDLVDQVQQSLHTQAVLLREIAISSISTAPDSAFHHKIRELGARTGSRFTVIRSDGVVVSDSQEAPDAMDNHRMRPEVLEAMAKGVGTAKRHSRTLDKDMIYVAVPVRVGGEHVGFARASVPLTFVDERLAGVRTIVVLSGVMAVLLALIIGLLVARGFTRPITLMTGAARAVAAGNYDRRVQVDRSDEIGQLASALNTMTSQLKEHIATITAENAKTVAILAGMVEGVVAVDSDERVVHINSAAEGILGITAEAALGKRIWEATRVREVSDSIADSMREHQVVVGEARIALQHKEQVIQTIAAPLRDADGELDGAIVVLHDVSELRQLEKVRRDFIANISHELKTPLAAIRGLVETLIDDRDMDEQTHDRFLEKIRVQSSRLSNLVVDLLMISRLEAEDPNLDFETIDLRKPVAESYRNLLPQAESGQIKVETLVLDEPIMVEGDAEALRELVDNLLSNAIKYTPPNGRVELRLSADGGNAVLEVEDTGIGIASEDQSRVFERFYRVDKARSRQMGGTGLGLSIVKHVALAHGGNVSVRSQRQQGSTFRVLLPLKSWAAESTKANENNRVET